MRTARFLLCQVLAVAMAVGAWGCAGYDAEAPAFSVNVSLSSKIATVAIVEWSTPLAPVQSAVVEFGLTASYGMQAPVDFTQSNNRTLLLGLKPSRKYHLRVVANRMGQTFTSEDHTIQTGPVTNLLAPPAMTLINASARAGGFIVAATYNKMSSGNPMAYILDADGELVWWHQVRLDNTTRARMTYDGKYLALISALSPNSSGAIELISMDGATSKMFNLRGANHDLVPTPDGKIGYLGAITGGTVPRPCGKIYELDISDGSTKLIYDTANLWSGSCHANALRYSVNEGIYTVSDLDHSQIIGVDRAGTFRWVANKDKLLWKWQHGHHLLKGSLLIYSNGNNEVFEYTMDGKGGLGKRIFSYQGGGKTRTLGDVQRLGNGNTLVTYSNEGVFHEVDARGKLVQIIKFKQAAPGYVMWRSSLYGAPDDLTL